MELAVWPKRSGPVLGIVAGSFLVFYSTFEMLSAFGAQNYVPGILACVAGVLAICTAAMRLRLRFRSPAHVRLRKDVFLLSALGIVAAVAKGGRAPFLSVFWIALCGYNLNNFVATLFSRGRRARSFS